MRFIATADWQLGMAARFLPPEARSRYTESRFETLTRIGAVAEERNAEFVVVCGDVFETNQLDRSVLARTFEALRSFTVPVVLVPGNHDPLDSASIYDSAEFVRRVPDHVIVARDSTPLRIGDAEVVAAPWFSKRPDADLLARACDGLAPPDPGVARVIAGHGAVASMNPDATDPATIDDAALAECLQQGLGDVVVLGDRHSTTEVRPGIWYPGTQEVTARRDPDPGNVLVIDVDVTRRPDAAQVVQVEPVHVGRWRFVTIEQTITGDEDLARLADRLDELTDKSRTGAWLMLTGTVSTAVSARLDRLLDEQGDLFALLKIWQSHSDLQVIPDDSDFSDLHLTGFAESALDELAAEARLTRATASGFDAGSAGSSAASSTDEARAAQDAIRLLYRLTGGN